MKMKQFATSRFDAFKQMMKVASVVGILFATVQAQSASTADSAAIQKPAERAAHTRYQPARFPKRAAMYYQQVWGIDSLTVKSAESGELIRFSFRVLDATKAKSLNDKRIDAFLFFPEGRVKLVIPSLEKVGQLRQSNTPQVGTSYWMAFSNPRRTVRRGDRVNVVIGQFHAEGLVVD